MLEEFACAGLVLVTWGYNTAVNYLIFPGVFPAMPDHAWRQAVDAGQEGDKSSLETFFEAIETWLGFYDEVRAFVAGKQADMKLFRLSLQPLADPGACIALWSSLTLGGVERQCIYVIYTSTLSPLQK